MASKPTTTPVNPHTAAPGQVTSAAMQATDGKGTPTTADKAAGATLHTTIKRPVDDGNRCKWAPKSTDKDPHQHVQW